MNLDNIEVFCVSLFCMIYFYDILANSKEADLKEWVISLGFGPQIKDINFEGNVIDEFKDGYEFF